MGILSRNHNKVYLVRAGARGEDEGCALARNMVIIGFQEYGSLDTMADFRSILKLVFKKHPTFRKSAIGNYAGQLNIFLFEMKIGDIVVLPRKGISRLALGIISGPYTYQRIGRKYRHTRPVRWIREDLPRSVFSQDLQYSFGAYRTICRISRNNAEKRIAAVMEGKPDPGLEY